MKNNVERQKLTFTSLADAREKVLSRGISTLLMADDVDYPLGIIGLVAGRLSEEFYRPAIVVKTGEKESAGSCRSIPEFNIIAALNQCHDLLSRYGGHSQAAGFTLPTKNLTLLGQRLSHLTAAQLEGVDLRPHLDIDALMNLRDLGGETFQSIQTLAPFGRGNPVPVFLSRGVEVVDSRTMGNNGDHLRLKLRMDGSVWDGVGFRLGNHKTEITPHIDIVHNLEVDNWKGKESLRLNIQDFASSSHL
jgi:single-stranded-DNA-specific exonuclease